MVVRAGHANQDGVAVARDQVYIIRDTQACPNRLGALAAASAPAPAVPAAGVAPAPVLGKPALSTAGYARHPQLDSPLIIVS